MAIPARPRHMHQAVYDKLIGDTISDDIKARLLALCDTCDCELGDHPTSVERVFRDFAISNLESGVATALNDDEIVGHVKLLRPAAGYLAKQMSLDSGLVEDMFRWIAGIGSPSEVESAREWFTDDLRSFLNDDGIALLISGPACWLFREDTGGDANLAFDSSPECLPCRLGLPSVLQMMPPYPHNLEFVGMCVSAGMVRNARSATVFHGDYVSVRDIWLPGGLTQPIANGPPACVGLGGLREFVADAPYYHEINDNVRVFLT